MFSFVNSWESRNKLLQTQFQVFTWWIWLLQTSDKHKFQELVNWSTQSSLRWKNKTGSIGFHIPVPEIQLSARAKVPSLQNSSNQLYQAIAHHAFVSQGRQGITAWFLFTSQICMNFPAKILLVHQVDSSNARVTSLPPRPCFQLGKLQTSTTEEQRGGRRFEGKKIITTGTSKRLKSSGSCSVPTWCSNFGIKVLKQTKQKTQRTDVPYYLTLTIWVAERALCHHLAQRSSRASNKRAKYEMKGAG